MAKSILVALALVTFQLPSMHAHAQQVDTVAIVKAALAVRDSINANKTFRAGLSIGWRHTITKRENLFRSVTISPADSTLRIDKTDWADVVLSGVVVAFPFGPGEGDRHVGNCGFCGFGFAANVNLATFSPDNVAVFNRSIEGGLGVAVAMSRNFSLGLTLERTFSRRLRSHIQAGQQLIVDGKVLTAVDPTDGRFFVDDNMSALSFKFMYFF